MAKDEELKVRVSQRMKDRIVTFATETDRSVSEVARQAIVDYLALHETPPTYKVNSSRVEQGVGTVVATADKNVKQYAGPLLQPKKVPRQNPRPQPGTKKK